MSDLNWLDRSMYPFAPHYLDLPMGRMHYVDEGQGAPVLMVHGTPTWSFLYRHLIQGLSQQYRCIAPDHLGFGLSDKPAGWTYRPADHARNLYTLIEHLGLRDITLVVHDFGGPIGLSYAIEHSENVRALVLFNTWMWSLTGDPSAERVNSFVRSFIGKFLYTRMNFSARMLIRAFWGDKSKLTRAIHRHYIKVFQTPQDRQSTWVLARELLGSSGWYDQLWHQRDRIKDKPALILWGMRDPAFKQPDLARWRTVLPFAKTVTFAEAGHFVQEEEAANFIPILKPFLDDVSQQARRALSTEANQLS